MPVAFRIDRGTLRPPVRTATGVRADAHISRTGVFVYRNPDGSERRELRPRSEVASPESLASFAMVPVTDDHPPTRVDTVNAPTYARGSSGETIRMDGDKVAATIVVFDSALIAKLDGGKVEVSCGYECDLDETPGVTEAGERYDAIQRNIRGNHIAIVDRGRAGPDVRVRMDAAVNVSAAERGEGYPMEELQKQLAAALEKAANEKARADRLEGERDAATKRADTAEAERDSERKRADTADKQRTDAASGFDAKVNARVELIASAGKVLRGDDLSKLTDRQIKVAFVEKVDGEKIDAAKSDDYVDAYFASAMKRADATAESFKRADGVQHVDATDEHAARQRMIAAENAAWKRGSN